MNTKPEVRLGQIEWLLLIAAAIVAAGVMAYRQWF
jgi:hypothetical protein